MTQHDQQKVLRAGFKIIRADRNNLLIKFRKDAETDWRTLEKGFKSKAALSRKMNELLELQTIIED